VSLPEKKPFRLDDVRSTSDPPSAVFSPDGRWLAYLSSDSNGTRTVFVEPFPPTGEKHPIGSAIWHPVWSPNGQQLFYRGSAAQEYMVRVTTQPSFAVSDPELLPNSSYQSRGRVEREYDVAPDGRFIGIVAAGQIQSASARSDVRAGATTTLAFGTAQQINVVVNWLEELKQRLPSRSR
jgi:hypothetical protein